MNLFLTNMNDQFDLADKLKLISEYEDGFRRQAFANASNEITMMTDEKFKSYRELGNWSEIHGFGKSIVECIQEYFETGSITRLNEHLGADSPIQG